MKEWNFLPSLLSDLHTPVNLSATWQGTAPPAHRQWMELCGGRRPPSVLHTWGIWHQDGNSSVWEQRQERERHPEYGRFTRSRSTFHLLQPQHQLTPEGTDTDRRYQNEPWTSASERLYHPVMHLRERNPAELFRKENFKGDQFMDMTVSTPRSLSLYFRTGIYFFAHKVIVVYGDKIATALLSPTTTLVDVSLSQNWESKHQKHIWGNKHRQRNWVKDNGETKAAPDLTWPDLRVP